MSRLLSRRRTPNAGPFAAHSPIIAEAAPLSNVFRMELASLTTLEPGT